MNIGVDLDGVIADFTNKFLEFYNLKTDSKMNFNDWKFYNFWELMNITREDAVELINNFYDSRLFDEINLINGAKKSIEELSKENELCIITSRPINFKLKTEAFLNKNFSEIAFNVFYSDDFNIGQGISKASICERKNIEIFIEDNVKYALSCSQKGVITFLFDKPWNQNYSNFNGLIRVKSWHEILEKIREIEK